jgi:DNA-binding MarR family transcriptional regulator
MTETGRGAWRDLMRVTAEVNARVNRELQRQAGISLADFEVLNAIARAPERQIRIFELGAALGWEQSRVSHQLGRMQRRELVVRSECAADGRGTFIALAAHGRRALRRATAAYDRVLGDTVLGNLTAAQLDALDDLTAALQMAAAT